MYLPILTYHRLLKESPDRQVDPKRISVSQAQFRAHLSWLARLGYRSVSLGDYPKQLRSGEKIPGKSFAITFDDGYEEVFSLALPVLKEFNFTATVFAVPGQVAGTNAWDDGHARLLSADQLRALRDAGITIGAHTSSHVHLPRVDAATARHEMVDSKERLEKLLGQPVATIAYPYGESTPEIETMAREAGFEAAFATDRAPVDHAANPFRIRRVVVFPRTTAWEVWWKVQRWYPAYQDWKRGE